MEYPEGGQIGQVGNGNHLWLPLLTHGFHWSYGAPKGTKLSNFWDRNATADVSIEKAKSRGFCAVVVDLRSDILPSQYWLQDSYLLGNYRIFQL
jgi:hypothetical protein